MPKAKAKPTTAKKSPATASFLLLDRSGSMGGAMWIEALGSINAYVKAVAEKLPQDKVTMAVFDGANNFEVIRDAVAAKSWPVVTDKDASPRGSTPLYDAIVKLCASATKEAIKKTTIVIMTDGAENASQEATKDTAKAALDAARKKGWDVLFLGANFDAMHQSGDVGTQSMHTINVAHGSMVNSMVRTMATRKFGYASGALDASTTGFSDEDRTTAGSAKVK